MDEDKEKYTYSQLLPDDIRLIKLLPSEADKTIQIELQHHNLYSPGLPSYFALSYCWGDPQDSCSIRIVDSKDIDKTQTLRITTSLHVALERLRWHDPEVEEATCIWVDQICINQCDLQERSVQVQMMWRIYADAAEVYAWLGDDDADSCKASSSNEGVIAASGPPLVQTSANVQGNGGIEPPQRSDYGGMLAAGLSDSGWNDSSGQFEVTRDLIKGTMTLLDRPYFSRGWVIPEMLQAKSLTFLYGFRDCPADELRLAIHKMVQSGWKYDTQKLVRINNILEIRRRISKAIDRLPRAYAAPLWEVTWGEEYTHGVTEQSTFLGALKSLHGAKCSDIRDKIYAGLACPEITYGAPRLRLTPDYHLTRDELVVVVVAHFDRLQGPSRPLRPLQNLAELSRILSRSLMLGDGRNLTEAYIEDVCASVRACIKRWTDGEVLSLKSGKEIGLPGPYLRFYSSQKHRS